MKKPIKLKLQKTIKVKPTKPFAFDSTFHKPDHFTSWDNYFEQGIRWQTWNWQGKCLGIKFSNKGTVENPLVEIKIFAKDKLSEDFVNSLFGKYKQLAVHYIWEDLFWKRKNEKIPWLEKEIRL